MDESIGNTSAMSTAKAMLGMVGQWFGDIHRILVAVCFCTPAQLRNQKANCACSMSLLPSLLIEKQEGGQVPELRKFWTCQKNCISAQP